MYLTVPAQGNGQISFVYGAGDIFAKCTIDGTQRKYLGSLTNSNHAQRKAYAFRYETRIEELGKRGASL